MDIVLINGVNFSEDNTEPQLGLIALKKVLNETFNVDIINFDTLYNQKKFFYTDDVNENIQEMAEYICRLNPRIASFYTICNTYPITILLAEKIKEINSEITVVFGGPQATLTSKETLENYPFVDIVARGEGETYITELVSAILKKSSLATVKGVAYRDEKGSICLTEMPSIIKGEELKEYTVLDLEQQPIVNKSRAYSVEAGRGCPYGCSFCSTSIFWGRNFRIKPIEDIIYEVKYLRENYGIKRFRLEHDLFTANRNYIIQFCHALKKENLDITWGCSSRIDILDEDMMQNLKEAGCNSIYIGFETGSQNMQKKLKKNIRVENADQKLLELYKYGFEVTVSFIYGFEEESEEDFVKTLQLIESLYCHNISKVQLHKFMPLPSTEETLKVSDKLHKDLSDIDISIYQSSRFNDKVQNIIFKNKEIHSCFFSFDSFVRTKYKRMDILITCLSLSFKQFAISCKYIISKYGLIKIYEMTKDILEKCYQDIQSLSLTQAYKNTATNELLIKLYIKMAHNFSKMDEDDNIKEIIRYETDLYDFTFSNKTSEIREYNVDIYNSVKVRQMITEKLDVPQKIQFIKRKSKISILKI